MFDFNRYIERLAAANRLARDEGFATARCSGVESLEGLLQQMQSAERIIAVSDVCDESLMQRGGGWMKRRLFTVFILSRFTLGDMADYGQQMGLCRELYRQLLSRLLRDGERWANDMIYLNMGDVRSMELGGTFLAGATGLYFMLTMDEPTDISYDESLWTD